MNLLESPLHVVLLGGFFVCLFAMIWWNTDARSMLIATLIALLVTGVGLVIERWVVTPRETVEQTLYDIAAEIDNEDRTKLLSYFHSSAGMLRSLAESELTRYTVTNGAITHIYDITVEPNSSPLRAVARFNARADVQGRFSDSRPVVLHFIVDFEQENGEWKILKYEWRDPRSPMMKDYQ